MYTSIICTIQQGLLPQCRRAIKGALDENNDIHNFFPKKVGILIPLAVLAWVKTQILHLFVQEIKTPAVIAKLTSSHNKQF